MVQNKYQKNISFKNCGQRWVAYFLQNILNLTYTENTNTNHKTHVKRKRNTYNLKKLITLNMLVQKALEILKSNYWPNKTACSTEDRARRVVAA